MDSNIDLSGLRDIHLPIEPPWWPPALGWWLVAAGILLGIVLLLAYLRHFYLQPDQYALRELKKIFQSETSAVLIARRLSVLLKRIVLFLHPRTKVATLTEEAWVTFLTHRTKSAFNEEQLNLLAVASYMPETTKTSVSLTELQAAARKAIITLFERKRHGHKSPKHSRSRRTAVKK